MDDHIDVAGYEGLYSVNRRGEIVSRPRPGGNNSTMPSKVMKPFNNGTGYMQVNLTGRDGTRKKHYVHRIVFSSFVSDIPEGLEVDHINNNRADNALSNLRLLTRADNLRKRCLTSSKKGNRK